MEDVRRLFSIGQKARALAAAAGLALIALGLLFGRRGARRAGVLLALAMITAVGVVAAVVAAAAAVYGADAAAVAKPFLRVESTATNVVVGEKFTVTTVPSENSVSCTERSWTRKR